MVSQERVILSAKGGKYCQPREGTIKSKERGIHIERWEGNIVSHGIGVFSAKGGEYCHPKEGNIVSQGRVIL
jgi:hypothetical protein